MLYAAVDILLSSLVCVALEICCVGPPVGYIADMKRYCIHARFILIIYAAEFNTIDNTIMANRNDIQLLPLHSDTAQFTIESLNIEHKYCAC